MKVTDHAASPDSSAAMRSCSWTRFGSGFDLGSSGTNVDHSPALAEIAARLGYCNAAYITNIFKRHVTMLPDGNRPATPAYKIRNL